MVVVPLIYLVKKETTQGYAQNPGLSPKLVIFLSLSVDIIFFFGREKPLIAASIKAQKQKISIVFDSVHKGKHHT